MSLSALERWRALRKDAPRDEYFRVLRAAVAEFYLADPANPYQQSGRSSGEQRWVAFVQRQYDAVTPGGRLILCHYRNATEPYVDVASVAEQAGYPVTGAARAPGVAIAWIQRPD